MSKSLHHDKAPVERTLLSALVTALAAVSLTVWIVSSADAEPRKALRAVPESVRPISVDIDVGARGFLVIAWLERRESRDGKPYLALSTRVKQPGDDRPREPKVLGNAGLGSVNVEIGSGDLAVLTWTGPDGFTRYAMRRPRSGWTPPAAIDGATSSDNVMSVGGDGTVIVADVVAKSTDDPNARAQVAVRSPGSGFSPWRTVSTRPEIVGFDVDVVAGREGRGTVAWSGFCGVEGSGNPSYYVDIDGESESLPVALENSRCTVLNFDLEMDSEGRQYLAIGTWTGLKFALRQPSSPFPSMTSLTNNYQSAKADLNVSKSGEMTLIWTRSRPSGIATNYRYVTASKGSEPSPARNLKGPRMNPKKVRDYLLDSAPLPDGSLSNFWSRTWKDDDLRFRHVFGVGSWSPGTRFSRPRYRFRIGKFTTPFPAKAETAADGSQLAWWIEENDRGEVLDVRFTYAPWRRGQTPGRS